MEGGERLSVNESERHRGRNSMDVEMEGWRCKLKKKKKKCLLPDFPHSAGTVLKLKIERLQEPDRLRNLPALER